VESGETVCHEIFILLLAYNYCFSGG